MCGLSSDCDISYLWCEDEPWTANRASEDSSGFGVR
jgi:hypothetical protein